MIHRVFIALLFIICLPNVSAEEESRDRAFEFYIGTFIVQTDETFEKGGYSYNPLNLASGFAYLNKNRFANFALMYSLRLHLGGLTPLPETRYATVYEAKHQPDGVSYIDTMYSVDISVGWTRVFFTFLNENLRLLAFLGPHFSVLEVAKPYAESAVDKFNFGLAGSISAEYHFSRRFYFFSRLGVFTDFYTFYELTRGLPSVQGPNDPAPPEKAYAFFEDSGWTFVFSMPIFFGIGIKFN